MNLDKKSEKKVSQSHQKQNSYFQTIALITYLFLLFILALAQIWQYFFQAQIFSWSTLGLILIALIVAYFYLKILKGLIEKIISQSEKEKDTLGKSEVGSLKANFLDITSHQLRTPLTIIKWQFSFLDEFVKKNKTVTIDKLREISKNGVLAADRLAQVIDNLIYISEILSGSKKAKIRAINLENLINLLIKEQELKNQNQPLNWQTDLEIKTLKSDENLIKTILSILLENALIYSPRIRPVEISSLAKESLIEISIIDQGIGIKQKDQKQIFDGFYRTEEAKKIYPDGKGTGLFLASQIAHSLQGYLRLESQFSQGSKFSLILPI